MLIREWTGYTRSSLVVMVALTLMACSDTTGQGPTKNNKNNTSQDMADRVDMPRDMTPSGLADGSVCAADDQCRSKVCQGLTCVATATGPSCGQAHCDQSQECVDGQCLAACDAGPRCQTQAGSVCCQAAQACLFERCLPLGDACDEQTPCPPQQFCEPTAGACVDRSADPNVCVYVPPAESFSPIEAFAWTQSADSPEYDQVMMTPMVANLTDDNNDSKINAKDTPDIVFATFKGNAYTQEGVLRVISGDGTKEHWSSSTLPVPFFVHGSTSPALADIDGDDIPEIIISAAPAEGGLMVIEHDGVIKWRRTDITTLIYGSVAVANLDGQGPPEIITYNQVLTHEGETICALPTGTHVPAAADLDGDGVQEIVQGSAIYKLTNPQARDGSGCEPVMQMGGLGGGFTALANLDDDPTPEIVHTLGGKVSLYEHDGTLKWEREIPLDFGRITQIYGLQSCTPTPKVGQACTTQADCDAPALAGQCVRNACRVHTACNPGGGPPTIADFDGDGQPEIAVATRWYYLVYERDGSILWAHSTKDFSSAVTGSSVFDFEGDGRAEVVYNDEEFLRVYRGAGAGVDNDGDGYNDPVILFEVKNTSGTLYEYPLIVDVDNDGNAEIVVMANNYSSDSMTKGIRIFRDANDNWVSTRRIWNQHTYHVTNIDEDGKVPLRETSNWTVPGLNNYRQNVQGDGLFNAPNLIIEGIEVLSAGCGSTGKVPIRVTIKNAGSLGVRQGSVLTSIWAGAPEELIATLPNTKDLAPGASEVLETTWTLPVRLLGRMFPVRASVDDDGAGMGRHSECKEDDNQASQEGILCEAPQ